jgi:hypothetical protein
VNVNRRGRLSLHPGRVRRWESEEGSVDAQVSWLRGIGAGISSNTLFELMEREVPVFAELSTQSRWSWFTKFTRKHQLVMRRPNHVTGSTLANEHEQADVFIRSVVDCMADHQVIAIVTIDCPNKSFKHV